MSDVALRRLLGLCSTGLSRPEHHALRVEMLARVKCWDDLVEIAESNGIGPLAARHLATLEAVPLTVRRGLLGLAARHTRAHDVRMEALADAIAALDAAGLRHLFLKGIALAQLVYPRPELRAMRDVDLLLREADLARAERALHDAGFTARTPARPGRHEVVTRTRTLSGFAVGIDLHRRLGILTLPRYAAAPRQTLDELWEDSRPVVIASLATRALGPEDMLRFVFRHGFCLQLDEDRLRLVAVADAVTAMESWVDGLDWARLRVLDPVAYRGLAMLHHVVPLSRGVLDALEYRPWRAPLGAAEQYWGWPRARRPSPLDAPAWLAATLFPSEWWLRTRHGSGAGAMGLATSWQAHLRELSGTGLRVVTGAPRPER